MRWSSSLLLAASAIASSAAEYDVIIVGGGPGGLVAAEYLTRAKDLSVLLLEAGPVSLQASGGKDVLPYAASKGFTKFDIPGEFDNTIYNPQNEKYRLEYTNKPFLWLGKLLGGCSSINAALYFRTADDYVTKASWPHSAEEVNAGYKEIETYFGFTDQPSTDGKHYLQEAYEIVQDALTGIGYAGKTLLDDEAKNAKNYTFGHAPYAIKNGLRDSPAKTFYSQLKTRDNFKLLTEAKVLYVEQKGGQATGVVYQAGGATKTEPLTKRGVVVMAAGALMTPAILMQSGVGPKAQLETLAAVGSAKFPGVSADKDDWVVNENVGQSLFDTNVVFATLEHPTMKSFLAKNRPESAITQYMKDQSGPWSIPGPVLISYENAQRGDREYEFQTTVLARGFGENVGAPNAYTLAFYVNNPKSRDSISFSANGDLQVYTKGSTQGSHPDDVTAMTWYAHKMLKTLTDAGSTFMDAKDASAATIAAWVKSKLGYGTHHFGGSCYTSGDKSDTKRCADETFKVVGTKNIYVSDGSLMKEGTVNPYGFIMYSGNQAGKNIVKAAFSGSEVAEPTGSNSNAGNTSNGGKASSNNSTIGGNSDVTKPPASSATSICGLGGAVIVTVLSLWL